MHDLRHHAARSMARMPGVTTKELMARIGVGGREILLVGGQISPGWWPRELLVCGRQISLLFVR